MSSRLERIRTKVARAKQHIADFQLGRDAFLATKPYAVSHKENPETGKRIYYVSRAECVPDSLAAIAADVIQNLRSPLDQVAYQLVVDANSGLPPANKDVVYYPITKAPSEYKALRARNIQGIGQDVIDAIDATEPYPGGKGHALWQLNELNKPDKHQLLVAMSFSSGGVDVTPDLRAITPEKFASLLDAFGPLYIMEADAGPAELGYEIFIEPIEHEVAKDRRFAFDITLNAPGIIKPEPALKTLQDMANLVDDIVTHISTKRLNDSRTDDTRSIGASAS